MININIKKEDERVKITELREGEFFLFEDSFSGREHLCQILTGDRVKTSADFPITFVYTENGETDGTMPGILVKKVDVEINVTLSR